MSLLKNITGNKKRNPKILAFSISLAGICLLSFFILASTAMATQPGQEHEKRVALQGSAHPPLPGMHIKGAVDPNKRIDVYVNLRYPPGCPPLPITREDFAKKLHDRKNLTHEEFLSCYGALEEDIAKVKKFARKNGLHVKAVDAAHRIVTLNGTLEALGRAFSVYLVIYSTPDFTFRGHNGPVFLPESLVPCVTGVHGLDNRPIVRPNLRILTAQDQTATTPVTSYKPQEVAKLYDFPQGLDGKGQSIAIIELSGGYNPDCLKKYFEDILGGVMPNITSVSVNNGANKPGVSQNSDNEVQLDIEVLGAIAPGADLYVYFTSAPTAAEFLKAVKQAVHNAEYQHTIISISWGMPECYLDKTILNSFNETFQEAAAKGITVLAATGDAGSYDQTADGLAHINFPSSASFVTSCGGTKLAASNGQSRDEIVWNEGALGANASAGCSSP